MSQMSVPAIDPDVDITTLATGAPARRMPQHCDTLGAQGETRVGLGSAAKMRGESDMLMRILQTA